MDAAPQRAASVLRASTARPIVVKLGGSVVRSGALASWLEVIAEAQTPVVIVPGGGALADEVRTCQQQLGFGEASAHRMALLAMDQLAWAVAGVRPGFEVGTTEAVLRAILGRGLVALWAPSALIAERTDIEATWRLTSDSLALWLAGKLGAERCYLIKSVAAARGTRSAQALAADGVVDEAFPAMLADTGVRAAIFGQGDQPALAEALAGDATQAGLLIE
ncbi:MAG: uridylate kinase [Methyloceanibacter sp.]|uniref:amino acid kinase family protein n=1 Tax=Methyloceanibacter sp. TaxID=1965321 RepID=UPI003EDFC777